MKRYLAAAAFALTAMAATTASAADCSGIAGTEWKAMKGYTVGAIAGGPDCQKAVALIVVRDGENNAVWHESYVAEQVMVLAGAQNSADMSKALAEWIDTANPAFETTANLPEWAEGADSPVNGDFPFYPEEGIDREMWNKIRAMKTPVYCYVQGMESVACLTNDPEMGFFKIGVQTFPG